MGLLFSFLFPPLRLLCRLIILYIRPVGTEISDKILHHTIAAEYEQVVHKAVEEVAVRTRPCLRP